MGKFNNDGFEDVLGSDYDDYLNYDYEDEYEKKLQSKFREVFNGEYAGEDSNPEHHVEEGEDSNPEYHVEAGEDKNPEFHVEPEEDVKPEFHVEPEEDKVPDYHVENDSNIYAEYAATESDEYDDEEEYGSEEEYGNEDVDYAGYSGAFPDNTKINGKKQRMKGGTWGKIIAGLLPVLIVYGISVGIDHISDFIDGDDYESEYEYEDEDELDEDLEYEDEVVANVMSDLEKQCFPMDGDAAAIEFGYDDELKLVFLGEKYDEYGDMYYEYDLYYIADDEFYLFAYYLEDDSSYEGSYYFSCTLTKEGDTYTLSELDTEDSFVQFDKSTMLGEAERDELLKQEELSMMNSMNEMEENDMKQ